MRHLLVRERMSFGDAVRFRETSATTRRRRMLRHEHRMIAPWSLASVIQRLRRREPFRDQVARLLHDMRLSPRLRVRELAVAQDELAAERRGGEALEDFVVVDHGRATRKQPMR